MKAWDGKRSYRFRLIICLALCLALTGCGGDGANGGYNDDGPFGSVTQESFENQEQDIAAGEESEEPGTEIQDDSQGKRDKTAQDKSGSSASPDSVDAEKKKDSEKKQDNSSKKIVSEHTACPSEKPGEKYTKISDGKSSYKDNYQTDPVPEGQKKPVEPQEVTVDKAVAGTCSLAIECSTVLDNMNQLKKGKASIVPEDGIIYQKEDVVFYEGESVSDVLKRETRNNAIHLEFTNTPGFNSDFIEGIGNLYYLDCGSLSGWSYCVNGWFPNYGCSRYVVEQGDQIEWHYTCSMGKDIRAGTGVK